MNSEESSNQNKDLFLFPLHPASCLKPLPQKNLILFPKNSIPMRQQEAEVSIVNPSKNQLSNEGAHKPDFSSEPNFKKINFDSIQIEQPGFAGKEANQSLPPQQEPFRDVTRGIL